MKSLLNHLNYSLYIDKIMYRKTTGPRGHHEAYEIIITSITQEKINFKRTDTLTNHTQSKNIFLDSFESK